MLPRPLLVAAGLVLGVGVLAPAAGPAQAASLELPAHATAAYANGPKWKGGKVKAYKVTRGRAYGHRALPGRRVGWYKRGYRPARAVYYR
jgi:hypothetical protein